MVRSQQKKKTEAAAQKPAEETSDVTEDDKNLNENRGVEEMETKTESDTTKKKDFEEVPIEDLPQKPTLAQEREEEFAFVRRKQIALPGKENSTYSTGRHTGGSGKEENRIFRL